MSYHATHVSVIDGSDACLIPPGWNSQGWGTLENENGDRWRDESADWKPINKEEVK
jgi:hypothetical protein